MGLSSFPGNPRRMRRRSILYLLIGLLHLSPPVNSFIRYCTGSHRPAISLSTRAKSEGEGKQRASSPYGSQKNEARLRKNLSGKSSKPTTSPKIETKPDTRKNLSAIIFNKWLSQYLREENGSPEEAERLLIEKVKEGVPRNDYDTLSFNLVLNAWARRRSKDSARRADRLLGILVQMSQLEPDSYSYSAVLNALAKSGGKREAALRAEKLLYQMEHSIKVTTDFCYNAVMDCWSESGSDDSGRRAQRWLTRLEERGPSPTKVSYNSCIKAWGRSRDGAAEAHRLLMRMKSIGGDLKPDVVSYSTCIDAWCRSTSNFTIAAEKAEELLQHMEIQSSENTDIVPDVVAYTSVLYAYAKAGVDVGRAMLLVDRMKRYAQQEPNTTFLNTLIHLFAKSRKIGQAEALLSKMKQNEMADKITYTSMISAHANVGNASRALALFEELEGLYNETKDERFLPTTKTFASVLYSMAKSRGGLVNDPICIAEGLMERLFERYRTTGNPELIPNTVVYSQMFLILSNSRHPSAPARAIKLMEQMKQAQRDGNRNINPDATTYAYLINTLTKARVPDAADKATEILREVEKGYEAGDDNLKPTKLLYSAVLQAFAKSASPEGARKAEQLLQRTKNLYKSGKMFAKPTVLYYNAVIDAHARSQLGRPAALRAEELLMELETRSRAGDAELFPTTRSYNAAILAWKNSNATDAPQRAEALLKRMNDRYGAGDRSCRPDRVTINSIISVWAQSGQENAPERAEAFLQFMEKLYYEAGDESLKPDIYSYNSVLSAYSSNKSPESARRASAIYETMKRLYGSGDLDIKPDIITLTSLRHAWLQCGDSEAKERLKEIGLLIAQERQVAEAAGQSVQEY